MQSSVRQKERLSRFLWLSSGFLSEATRDALFARFLSSELFVAGDSLEIDFVRFILSDPYCTKLLSVAPPFLPSLLKFERAEAELARREYRESDPTLPDGSLLRHRAYVTVKLDYDVPTFLKARANDPALRAPIKRTVIVLLAKSKGARPVRMIRITGPTRDFLANEETRVKKRVLVPSSFALLVRIGLCRPLASVPAPVRPPRTPTGAGGA